MIAYERGYYANKKKRKKRKKEISTSTPSNFNQILVAVITINRESLMIFQRSKVGGVA